MDVEGEGGRAGRQQQPAPVAAPQPVRAPEQDEERQVRGEDVREEPAVEQLTPAAGDPGTGDEEVQGGGEEGDTARQPVAPRKRPVGQRRQQQGGDDDQLVGDRQRHEAEAERVGEGDHDRPAGRVELRRVAALVVGEPARQPARAQRLDRRPRPLQVEGVVDRREGVGQRDRGAVDPARRVVGVPIGRAEPEGHAQQQRRQRRRPELPLPGRAGRVLGPPPRPESADPRGLPRGHLARLAPEWRPGADVGRRAEQDTEAAVGVVEPVPGDRRQQEAGAAPPEEEAVERRVEPEQGQRQEGRDAEQQRLDEQEGEDQAQQADGDHAEPVRRLQVEVGGEDALAQQQPGPGDAPVADVGAQQARRRPALEVLHLEVVAEAHAVAGARQPVAQLDVLDARALVARVEPAHREEDIPPDRAAAGPEGRRLRVRGLVDVVVEEVLVLREEVRLARAVVVRSEEGAQPRVGAEGPQHQPDRLGTDGHVGVDEEEEFTARDGRAQVARRGRAGPRPRTGEHPRARPPRQLVRSVGRPVIHDDQLPGRVRRRGVQRVEAAREGRPAVVDRHDHRHGRGRGRLRGQARAARAGGRPNGRFRHRQPGPPRLALPVRRRSQELVPSRYGGQRATRPARRRQHR